MKETELTRLMREYRVVSEMRDRAILDARKTKTLGQIAKRFGISRPRVVHILHRATALNGSNAP